MRCAPPGRSTSHRHGASRWAARSSAISFSLSSPLSPAPLPALSPCALQVVDAAKLTISVARTRVSRRLSLRAPRAILSPLELCRRRRTRDYRGAGRKLLFPKDLQFVSPKTHAAIQLPRDGVRQPKNHSKSLQQNTLGLMAFRRVSHALRSVASGACTAMKARRATMARCELVIDFTNDDLLDFKI